MIVLAVGGCSGTSSRAPSDPPGHEAATGSVDDWVTAVCQPGSYQRTRSNPVIMCNSKLNEVDGYTSQVYVFEYRSRPEMQTDRKRWDGQFGHATCTNSGTDFTLIFRPAVFNIVSPELAADIAEQRLQPLAEYGCSISSPGSVSGPTPQIPTQPPVVPAPSAPPGPTEGVELPADAFGYVAVETASRRTRCQIESSRVICENSDGNWPAVGVEITTDGSTRFANGNLGNIRPTTLAYQTYRALGWTVVASSADTRFINDRTGHGAVVSAERVEPL